MLVVVDRVARLVLGGIQLRLFSGADRAVLKVLRFHVILVLLIALERAGFFGRKLARFEALLDPLLLVDVALLVLFSGRLRPGSRTQHGGREGDQGQFR